MSSSAEWVTIGNKKKSGGRRENSQSDRSRPSPNFSGRSEPNRPGSRFPKSSHEPPNLSLQNSSLPPTEIITEKHPLNDTWVFWYHDVKSTDWTITGVEKLFTFNTVEDFWILYNKIGDNSIDLTNGMYYLMREGYPPLWDHEKNIDGGAWTFKVDKRQLGKFWEEISCYCVGESICSAPETVVGLSVSPKIRFVTVRVWTSNITQPDKLYEIVAKETQTNALPINFKDARFTGNRQANV
jgi:hypothetical protein